MGNKGAVAASLRVHSSTVCIVCSHLASGSSAVDARNVEYSQLLQRITFQEDYNYGLALSDEVMRCVMVHQFLVYRAANAKKKNAIKFHRRLVD